ncbi:T9SS type A sorting domain-containing protein, partial [Marinilabilia sp.]|uniref:T9SS type A sorting domain-containing protein n=1 Tax=Marinilabilia sp. TaxID=2021252 RepID=UPI0025BEED25
TLEFYWNNSSAYTGIHEPSFCVDEVMITGKSVERPVSFSATVINVSQIDLAWEKNSEGQDVLIAFSSSGTLGAPDENISYTEGDILPGGGKVIYKGSATTYSHFIEGESKANYKIWSVSTADTYSTALSASTVMPASLPFFDGFEEDFFWNTIPSTNNNWYRGQADSKTGSFSAYVSENGGFTTDFNNNYSADPAVLELPVNLAGFSSISIDFDWKLDGYIENTYGYVQLENGGATYAMDDFVAGRTPDRLADQPTWQSITDWTISNDTYFSAGSVLRFYMAINGGENPGFVVDNINIDGILKPVSTPAVENNGGLKNYVSWTNAAQNLEVVVVAGLNGEAIGDVTSGTTYYVGDVLSNGGKVVYIGTGSTFSDENVMPGQQYQYKVFQKNGLTYSTGALTGTVTVPDNVGFYEDFENGTNAWTPTNFNGNTWHVGSPVTYGNGSDVAFLTNDTINAQYTFDNKQGAKVEFSKSFSFAAFSSGTVLEFDYLANVKTGDIAYVSLIDHNNGDAELLSTTQVANGSWTSFSSAVSPVADVAGTNSLTIVFGVDITTASDGTYSPGFLVDNISITGSNDNTSTVSNGAGGVPSISSLKDTEAEAVEVFTFDITDAGSGDAKPTDIHQMTITPGTGNTISNWREVIGGAALYDATDVLIAYGSIQTAGIFFDQENMIRVADGGTENYKLKIWLQESLATNVDNEGLGFHLTSDNIAAYNGSSFGDPGSTSVNSTTSTVSISATELRFDQQASTSAVSGIVLSTQPVVVATDANGNVDSDYISDVSLVSAPTGVAGTTTVTPLSGSATFTDVLFNSLGVYQITASSGTLTSVTSQDITVSVGGSGTTDGGQYIGAVKLAGIENYTYERSLGGYGLFLDQEARMTKGLSYELSVFVVGGSANLRVYIDYDGDNVYDAPSEELHDFGTVSDGVHSSWVTIPTTQSTGTFRLKVEFVDGSGNGEIEDYTVIATDNQWTGYTPEWDVNANWSSGQVPVDNVYIPGNPVDGNFFPVLDIDRAIDQLTLEPGANITLKPGVSMTVNSALNNNGLIVLKSTVDAVSALNVPQGNTDSGNGQIELPLVGNQWFRLGQPFASPTGAMYKAGDTSSWVYRSTTNWQRITDAANAIAPMEGIMVLYENDVTLNSTGSLNTGTMSWTIPYGRGYYLFSNPYPSAMKWAPKYSDEVNDSGVGVSDNLDATIYYRVYAGAIVGDYMITYNGSAGISTYVDGLPGGYTEENIGNISPMQSVWVKVNDAASATIDLDNRARSTDNSVPLKSASSSDGERKTIRILQSNEFISDVALISFAEGYVETIDREDSEKMFNSSTNVPEIYTRVDLKALAINGLPALSGESYTFPISVRNRVSGEVSFSANLDEFTSNFDVVLEDKVAGEWINLRTIDEYIYTPAQLGDVHDRFVLHLNRVQQVATTIEENNMEENVKDIFIIGKKESVLVKINAELLNSGEATIEVMDINGRLVNSKQTTSSETEVALPSASGMYVIKVNADGQHKTEKVLKK